MRQKHIATALLAAGLLVFAAGCKKKTPVATPPPPPPPPAAKVEKGPAAVISSFTAEPSTIVRGEAATLRWSVANATEVTIDNGIGAVSSSGSRQVYPTSNTTYRMTAKGAGGDAIAAVTVAVTTPPPPPPPPPQAQKASLEERMNREIQDVFFDYDKSEVREDSRATLQRNGDALKAILADFPSAVVSVEGHCDERGSAEYNLGLGDRRAASAREFLIQVGVPGDRLKPISYGKEKPACTEASESCYQKNRRVHFVGVQ